MPTATTMHIGKKYEIFTSSAKDHPETMLEPPTNIRPEDKETTEQILSAAEDHKMERKVSGPWVKIKKQTKNNNFRTNMEPKELHRAIFKKGQSNI